MTSLSKVVSSPATAAVIFRLFRFFQLIVADSRLISLREGCEEFEIVEIRSSAPEGRRVKLIQKLLLELCNELITVVHTDILAFLQPFFEVSNLLPDS